MKKIRDYFSNLIKGVKKIVKDLPRHRCLQNRKRNILIVTVVAVILLAVLLARFVLIAALVNGRPISRIAIIQGLEKQYGQTILDNLIDKNLAYQEAGKLKISVSQDEINTELQKIGDVLKNQNITLQDALASQGLTQSQLVEQIRFQKTVEAILTPKITVSDQEIKDYFTKNKDVFDKKATLESVKDQIKEQLFQEKLTTEYKTWIADLRAKAKINYFVNY